MCHLRWWRLSWPALCMMWITPELITSIWSTHVSPDHSIFPLSSRCSRPRIRPSADVQWWRGARESPPSCGLQAAPEPRLRHLQQPLAQTEGLSQEDDDRHGEWVRLWLLLSWYFWLSIGRFCDLLLSDWLTFTGAGHWHEQAHEAACRPQDNVGNQESHWQRSPHARRL